MAFSVGSGCDTLYPLEKLCKITVVIEAAFQCDIDNGKGSRCQQHGRLFDPVKYDIVHRGLLSHILKHFAEVVRVHAGNVCQRG